MENSGFKHDNLDLAAAVWTATNERPIVTPGFSLVEFTHPDSKQVRAVAMAFACGSLTQNVKQFAAHRAKLYHLVREVSRAGGAK